MRFVLYMCRYAHTTYPVHVLCCIIHYMSVSFTFLGNYVRLTSIQKNYVHSVSVSAVRRAYILFKFFRSVKRRTRHHPARSAPNCTFYIWIKNAVYKTATEIRYSGTWENCLSTKNSFEKRKTQQPETSKKDEKNNKKYFNDLNTEKNQHRRE